jgi:molecular chaperone GrpE (heat shock protein)
MKKWISNLINPRREPDAGEKPPVVLESPASPGQPVTGNTNILNLQKEAQSLRMEIEARDGSIANLKQEIERLRLRQEQVIEETIDQRLSGLFSDLAAPSSQILTQAELLEQQGKPVQARDVLAVARRMVRALERYGVVFVHQVGDQVAFDPNQHTPISGTASPQPGQPVTVRFTGVAYQGKIIYKAVVE